MAIASRFVVQSELYPPFVCGEGMFARNLATGLRDRGHRVLVVAASKEGAPSRTVEEGIEVVRLRSIANPLYGTFRLSFGGSRVLHELVDDFRPDAIHLNNPSRTGRILLEIAAQRDVATLATNHYHPGTALANGRLPRILGSLYGRLAFRVLRDFYSRADRLTTPSRYAAELLRDHGWRRDIEVVSNGVDVRRFHPAHRERNVLERLGIPPGSRVLLQHGRLHPSKRCDLPLAAMERLPPDVWMIVSGSGPDARRLRSIAPPRVVFLGGTSAEELPRLYASSSALVIASPWELQGITILEALASGLPVVGADAGAIEELVIAGISGLRFPVDSVEGCAKACLEVLADPAPLREGARAIALEHSMSGVLDRFERLLLDPPGRFRHPGVPSHRTRI